MTRLLKHARQNTIAYLALFIALGGTGYAAISLPAGSVGNRQLQKHAVAPINLSQGIGGYVGAWAQISSTGKVVNSSPRARLRGWSTLNPGGQIIWDRKFPRTCVAIATVGSSGGESDAFGVGFANVRASPGAGNVIFNVYNAAGQIAAEPVAVALICPHS